MPVRTFPHRPRSCPGHNWGKISHNGTDYNFWVCDKCARHVNVVWQCQLCGCTTCSVCHEHSENAGGVDVKMKRYL